jgi:methylmalonyl-CoA/ethylmalonyl-CoA epimerase
VKIHHIGLAVRSLQESLAFYRDALGLQVTTTEEVPSEGVRVAFLPMGQPRIELLEALGPDSPIAKFVAKRGEGIHHLCFEVADVEAAVERLRRGGAEIIEPAIRVGAGGHRIAFVHPRSSHGVLVELKEVREGLTEPRKGGAR